MSKAIEGVAEVLAPPPLEAATVSLFDLIDPFLRRTKLGLVRLPGERHCADDPVAPFLQPASQIRKRTALADEIVHHQILSTTLDLALECGLSTKASAAVGTGTTDDVRLDYIGIVRQPDVLADEVSKRSRNGVESIVFVCVCADQHRGAITNCSGEQPPDLGNAPFLEQCGH